MGRCYEFGVLVGDGCEHAMVVPASGRRCECATCGVECTGRFAGCAAILDRPGYVPSTAPAWAVAVGDPSAPPAPDGAPAPAAAEVGPGRSSSPAADPDPVDLVGAIEGVAKQLAEHDVELATRLDVLAGQVLELQRHIARQATHLESLLTRLAAIDRRLDESRLGSLFGLPRRQS